MVKTDKDFSEGEREVTPSSKRQQKTFLEQFVMCLSYLYRGKITHTMVAFVFPVMLDVRDILSGIVLYNHINSLSLNCGQSMQISFYKKIQRTSDFFYNALRMAESSCEPANLDPRAFLPCYASLNKRATCEQYVWFTSLIGCFDNSNGQKQNKILTWR